MTVLSAHNIVAGYVDEIDILQNVSVDVQEQQITSVIGPNGSGKSTLMRVICGFLTPKSGQVLWDDTDLTGRQSHTMAGLGICYLPQERTVYPHLTVEQNIYLGGWTFRRDKARIRHELSRVYDLFPMMQERRKSKAGNLSGGMQKILEVARGMMIRPEILICDEPTVGLAPIIAKEVYDTIERLKADGLTILLVDQNVREAIRIGDQIYVLEVGQNKVNGTRAEFEANQHDMIKDWLQI
ncbi:MAG TPA: ABC transporter ATP-binding protein [Gammaproteobacteria bacterium]|nr:ABC transporter ATP-binding protein [Gammaproteobacteria bacterium]HBK75437.1 ABC transporter ATP-binding protein [Gammaproteobacteria bacterium]HIB07102.1 ABC transporter ATP-binding protein [Gammaproteobacteria bacterium]HIM99054.1 ABC transporter ATP-binding protein [Gammaproteobacteria bacterium]